MNYFWSTALNAFVFPFGTLAITLFDLAVLFGLQPYDAKLDPTYEIDTSSFNFILPNKAEFCIFLDVY